jgi:hypothetical protein
MSITATSVNSLMEAELRRLSDRRVLDHVRRLLVPPHPQMRPWDYGAAEEAYPCWMVLEHRPSNTGIAYCDRGFGPAHPWGLLFLEGTSHMSMGMDSGWFEHFLVAYFDSRASADLPIWRVFRSQGRGFPGTPITEEDGWDETWAKVMRLRSEQPDERFNCWQSVYQSAAHAP